MEQCDYPECTEDYCASLGGDDRGECIERDWNGTETITTCEACGAWTWHRDGNCLRCRSKEAKGESVPDRLEDELSSLRTWRRVSVARRYGSLAMYELRRSC